MLYLRRRNQDLGDETALTEEERKRAEKLLQEGEQ